MHWLTCNLGQALSTEAKAALLPSPLCTLALWEPPPKCRRVRLSEARVDIKGRQLSGRLRLRKPATQPQVPLRSVCVRVCMCVCVYVCVCVCARVHENV